MTKERVRDGPHTKTASRRRAGSGSAGPRPAETRVQAAIGNRLRAYYEEVAREPVPERFVELLKKLDSKDRAES